MIHPSSKILNILIVEDHPLIADAYIDLIKSASNDFEYKFKKACNCMTAFKNLELEFKIRSNLDIAIIDLNIPAYHQEKMLSGTDVAQLIRTKFPDCKIIISTMHSEHLILNSVFKTIEPEGFISKNDIDFSTFSEIFLTVVNGQSYYSPSITQSLQKLFRDTIKWDEFDTQIILLTEKSFKNKDIAAYINLSLSTVEKRKANIKRQLADQKVNDDQLIKICKMLKLL